MPSLKRSPNPVKKPAGLGEDQILLQAITLLFFLKGKQYQKKHPEFTIPSAHEFLSYCRMVSDEAFDKSRKDIAQAKYAKGASSCAKKIASARPFSSPCGTCTYTDFLRYMIPSVDNNLILCIQTVVYALHLYLYIQAFMMMLEDGELSTVDRVRAVSQHVKQTESKRQFATCFLRFLTAHMPTVIDIRERIVEDALVCSDTVCDAMPGFGAAYHKDLHLSSGCIAQFVLDGFEKNFVESTQFKRAIKHIHCDLETIAVTA